MMKLLARWRRVRRNIANYRSAAILIVAYCLTATQCEAHQKWLAPNFFVAEKLPVWVSFDVTWSDQPFTAESGVGERPLWVVDPSGNRQRPSQVFVGKTKSVAEMELTQPGTYRLESIDPLTYWTRVEHDGKPQWIEKPKNEVKDVRITRADLYWSKAVAYVTIGEPTDVPPQDDSEPLDIRPATHPNRIRAGEPIELRVLSYGKPQPNAKIKVFGPGSTGHSPSQEIGGDENGAVKIELNTPGRHLFACELEREVKDDPKADIHSFNLYLTIMVEPLPE